MTLYQEEALLQLLQAGKEEAFNTLYKRFYQRMYFFALRFVPEADAKDMVSEAFVALWQKRTDFTAVPSVQHFLFVIVRNRCLNLLKHEMMKMQQQADILHQLEQSTEEDLDLEHLQAELVKHIYQEVEKLPQKMRTIFLLSFQEGLKPAAIAERLNVSVQTVRNQKVTAIRVLRTALGEKAFLLSLLLLIASES